MWIIKILIINFINVAFQKLVLSYNQLSYYWYTCRETNFCFMKNLFHFQTYRNWLACFTQSVGILSFTYLTFFVSMTSEMNLIHKKLNSKYHFLSTFLSNNDDSKKKKGIKVQLWENCSLFFSILHKFTSTLHYQHSCPCS